jgi:hypothetical protein
MYHEGGPVGLKINDPTDPMELLRNANLFLESFQNTPDQVATPYEATLAPVTIARGPLPLNDADIAHAQDVLVFCAKRRSALLDQLNLLQFILDHPAKFDFSNGASAANIQQAAVDTQVDLDLIASCASAAINRPAQALFPADFAATIHTTFPKAIMPPLPLSSNSGSVQEGVPALIGKSVIAAVQTLIDLGLTPGVNTRNVVDLTQHGIVLDQFPPGGAPAKKGDMVTLSWGRIDGGQNLDPIALQLLSEFGI